MGLKLHCTGRLVVRDPCYGADDPQVRIDGAAEGAWSVEEERGAPLPGAPPEVADRLGFLARADGRVPVRWEVVEENLCFDSAQVGLYAGESGFPVGCCYDPWRLEVSVGRDDTGAVVAVRARWHSAHLPERYWVAGPWHIRLTRGRLSAWNEDDAGCVELGLTDLFCGDLDEARGELHLTDEVWAELEPLLRRAGAVRGARAG